MRSLAGLQSALIVLLGAGRSLALDEQLSDVARGPILPELTHRFVELGAETTFGRVALVATPGVQAPEHRSVTVERVTFEAPVLGRRWYLGASYEVALGSRAVGGTAVASGNPEVHVRGVSSSVTGVAFGGGLALIAPGATLLTDSDIDAVRSAAVAVRGWDRAAFDPHMATVRGFIDARDTVGPVVIQYRQAIEAAAAQGALAYSLAGIGTLYVGYTVSPQLTIGASVVEYYNLDPVVSDESRAHWSVGGDVRLTTRYFLPTLGVDTNLGSPIRAISSLGSPLSASPETFVSLRIGLTFIAERSAGRAKN